MKRLLTGIQPTGDLHVGNYLGSIKQVLKLQKEYDVYLMIADLHALTIKQDPKKYQQQIKNLAATLIASGVNPAKATIFVQSQVPEHTELAWIFNTITPVGELERMTQYKEKSDKHGQNAGLLTYPVLQAADILLYRPKVVPVGDDQVQHLELTKTIVRKFNRKYGLTFDEPRTLLTKSARIMALNKPHKKMSKSIPGSYIPLDADSESIKAKVMKAVTDTAPGKKMSPGVKNLFVLLESFAPEKAKPLKKKFQNGSLRYRELKEKLAQAIIKDLLPIRRKKDDLLNSSKLESVLRKGALKAQKIAAQTMKEVKRKVGLI